MIQQAATLIFSGLRCDAEGCDYRDDTSVPSADLVGKPCPKCGANLLTDDDWLAICVMRGIVEIANAASGPVPDGTRMGIAPIHMDGSGEVSIGEFVPESE